MPAALGFRLPVAPRPMQFPTAPPTGGIRPVTPPIGRARPFSFRKGGKVQKSGLALVHKGETIKPAPKSAVPTRNAALKAMENKLSKKPKQASVMDSLGMEGVPNGNT